MEIHNLFPVKAGNIRDCLTNEQLDAIKARVAEIYNGCDLDFVQTTGDFHQEEVAKPLVEYILNVAVPEYAKAHGVLFNKFIITNMWVNRYKTGANIHSHIHSNSLYSGVFYLDDNGFTILDDPMYVAKNMIRPEVVMGTIDNSDAYTNHSIANSIFLFPSWVKHTSSPNMEEEDRFNIAFNVITEKLGTDEAFNRLVVKT